MQQERPPPAAEREVQVLQVLQGGEGAHAGVAQPGALGGVDPAEASGASAQSLPAGVRQLVVTWSQRQRWVPPWKVHVGGIRGSEAHPRVQRCGGWRSQRWPSARRWKGEGRPAETWRSESGSRRSAPAGTERATPHARAAPSSSANFVVHTYQDTSVGQRRHVIDHDLSEQTTSS